MENIYIEWEQKKNQKMTHCSQAIRMQEAELTGQYKMMQKMHSKRTGKN